MTGWIETGLEMGQKTLGWNTAATLSLELKKNIMRIAMECNNNRGERNKSLEANEKCAHAYEGMDD